MKQLATLLEGIPVISITGVSERIVNQLHFDSRLVAVQDIFVAVRGTQTDGHAYIEKAIKLGATVVICDVLPELIKDDVTYILVKDTSYGLALLASNYYNRPSSKLKLVGVTGTNGKTTVVTLLHKLFLGLGFKVGLLSTVHNQINDEIIPSTHTTPNPVELNRLLAKMIEVGCDYCFMEVSSHAVVQNRIAGLHFVGGVFTNISHDHLDFHQTFPKYIKAKKTFFDNLSKHAFALTNIDDKNGLVMLQNTVSYKKTYGLRNIADFKGKVIESHFDGMLMQLDDKQLWVKLIGHFNAYNILAAYGTALLLEQDTMKVLTGLSKITGAEGRFDVQKAQNGVIGVIDYAHTPDAVENVLTTINELRLGGGNIITVVGCGGDRDKSKRPEMAHVASLLSNKVILTSDNPRSEDPQKIIQDMEKGVLPDKRRHVFSITERSEAIKAAYHLATPGDIILIAGKGHEKYQEINGVKKHFDDKEILRDLFNSTSTI